MIKEGEICQLRVKEVGMPFLIKMNIHILNPNKYLVLKLNSKYNPTVMKLVKTNKQDMSLTLKL